MAAPAKRNLKSTQVTVRIDNHLYDFILSNTSENRSFASVLVELAKIGVSAKKNQANNFVVNDNDTGIDIDLLKAQIVDELREEIIQLKINQETTKPPDKPPIETFSSYFLQDELRENQVIEIHDFPQESKIPIKEFK